MFGLNDGMRYYVCQRYVRMNLGINGLYKLVSQEMDLPPLSGAVFIFFSKNRQQVKLLRWDTDGFTLYQKRKRVRDAAFFFIIMLVTFAATLLKPQKYVSSRTIQKCVEHVSTST